MHEVAQVVTEERTPGGTDGLCTGDIGRETTGGGAHRVVHRGTPRWKYTGNATCSGGEVGEHVRNALGTQELRPHHEQM